MSVPGTAADGSISCSGAISTVPGTGPRVRNPLESGTPAHCTHSIRAGGSHLAQRYTGFRSPRTSWYQTIVSGSGNSMKKVRASLPPIVTCMTSFLVKKY